MEILDSIPFDVDAHEVLRRAHLTKADADITQGARELIEQARQVARPKVVYEVCYVENKRTDSLELAGITFTSRVLRMNLDQVQRIFAYVATCGTELTEISAPAGDMLLDYCLDIIKEMALRTAMAHLRKHLETRYALGQTSSMNPGSLEDWPITQQNELFSIFGDVEKLIGVRLSDSFLMIPTKSVSGIIFPTQVRFESCQLCPREVCPSRRAAFDSSLAEQYGIEVAGTAGEIH